jgi:phospholipid/cholesterol/gamma-HCH transport system ATP-binding protein
MIKIENISKSFNGISILRNVNLIIDKGSTQVILGKSGTGKSVLLKLIVGLLSPDNGRILIDNKDLTNISLKELNKIRKKIGFLFQNAALYDSLSVRENLEFALRNKKTLSKSVKNSKVEEYLDAVELLGSIDKMPSDLSGGMRKRVGLARALITEPDLLLYDEPTTGLDPITTRGISYLIREVQKKFNLTSIAVTHDLECAKIIANQISMLNEGEICFNGAFDELENSEIMIVKEFLGKNI